MNYLGKGLVVTENSDLLNPLKTWSHLVSQRRRPSEYEIVSTNLLWSTDGEMPWALSPDIDMNQWYLKYRNQSPIKHKDWDSFRDPDELVYRTYNIQQDGQETYIDGLLDEHNRNEHDAGYSNDWLMYLLKSYTPARYLLHAMQMGSAYLVQMVPASTIENCAMLQAADQLRWISRISYRTKELQKRWPAFQFGQQERACWETEDSWQGFRELMERILVSYDWGEHFVALNIIAKPSIDEAFIRQLGKAARRNGDMLLALLNDAQMLDSERSRRWTKSLVEFVLKNDENRKVLEGWVDKWAPLGDKAIELYCSGLPDSSEATLEAKNAVKNWRESIGIKA